MAAAPPPPQGGSDLLQDTNAPGLRCNRSEAGLAAASPRATSAPPFDYSALWGCNLPVPSHARSLLASSPRNPVPSLFQPSPRRGAALMMSPASFRPLEGWLQSPRADHHLLRAGTSGPAYVDLFAAPPLANPTSTPSQQSGCDQLQAPGSSRAAPEPPNSPTMSGARAGDARKTAVSNHSEAIRQFLASPVKAPNSGGRLPAAGDAWLRSRKRFHPEDFTSVACSSAVKVDDAACSLDLGAAATPFVTQALSMVPLPGAGDAMAWCNAMTAAGDGLLPENLLIAPLFPPEQRQGGQGPLPSTPPALPLLPGLSLPDMPMDDVGGLQTPADSDLAQQQQEGEEEEESERGSGRRSQLRTPQPARSKGRRASAAGGRQRQARAVSEDAAAPVLQQVVKLEQGEPMPGAVQELPQPVSEVLKFQEQQQTLPQPGAMSRQADPALLAGNKRCNCKKSQCLKLYCDCFSAQVYCQGCACASCRNTPAHAALVMEKQVQIKNRDPLAFEKKIQSMDQVGLAQHKKGCNCKKSNCLKKYCECYQGSVMCGPHCKCLDCRNTTAVQPSALPVPRASSRQSSRASARTQESAPAPVPVLSTGGWAAQDSITKARQVSSGASGLPEPSALPQHSSGLLSKGSTAMALNLGGLFLSPSSGGLGSGSALLAGLPQVDTPSGEQDKAGACQQSGGRKRGCSTTQAPAADGSPDTSAQPSESITVDLGSLPAVRGGSFSSRRLSAGAAAAGSPAGGPAGADAAAANATAGSCGARAAAPANHQAAQGEGAGTGAGFVHPPVVTGKLPPSFLPANGCDVPQVAPVPLAHQTHVVFCGSEASREQAYSGPTQQQQQQQGQDDGRQQDQGCSAGPTAKAGDTAAGCSAAAAVAAVDQGLLCNEGGLDALPELTFSTPHAGGDLTPATLFGLTSEFSLTSPHALHHLSNLSSSLPTFFYGEGRAGTGQALLPTSPLDMAGLDGSQGQTSDCHFTGFNPQSPPSHLQMPPDPLHFFSPADSAWAPMCLSKMQSCPASQEQYSQPYATQGHAAASNPGSQGLGESEAQLDSSGDAPGVCSDAMMRLRGAADQSSGQGSAMVPVGQDIQGMAGGMAWGAASGAERLPLPHVSVRGNEHRVHCLLTPVRVQTGTAANRVVIGHGSINGGAAATGTAPAAAPAGSQGAGATRGGEPALAGGAGPVQVVAGMRLPGGRSEAIGPGLLQLSRAPAPQQQQQQQQRQAGLARPTGPDNALPCEGLFARHGSGLRLAPAPGLGGGRGGADGEDAKQQALDYILNRHKPSAAQPQGQAAGPQAGGAGGPQPAVSPRAGGGGGGADAFVGHARVQRPVHAQPGSLSAPSAGGCGPAAGSLTQPSAMHVGGALAAHASHSMVPTAAAAKRSACDMSPLRGDLWPGGFTPCAGDPFLTPPYSPGFFNCVFAASPVAQPQGQQGQQGQAHQGQQGQQGRSQLDPPASPRQPQTQSPTQRRLGPGMLLVRPSPLRHTLKRHKANDEAGAMSWEARGHASN